MKNLFKILLCGLAMTAVFACTDNKAEDVPAPNGGLEEKSCADREEISGEEQEFEVTFKTKSAWTAKLSNTAFASVKEGAKGEAGDGRIVVAFKQNTSDASRIVTLSLSINGKSVSVCRFTQLSLRQKGTDAEVNMQFTWPWLEDMYLWNEELRNNVTPDYKAAYDDFLENSIRALYDINQVNAKDGYWSPSPTASKKEWIFYSNISRTSLVSAAASKNSVTRAAKEMILGMGIYADIWGFDEAGSTVCFPVLWVYPDSPAEKAGVKRGDIIYKVNGAQPRTAGDAWVSDYLTLCAENPASTSCTVTLYDNGKDGATYSISSGRYYETTVVFRQVFSVTPQGQSTHKVGYVVYTGFENAYDSDLEEVFAKFQSEGITDIILDLRHNGGGHVSSARLLCSILGGQACKGKVFEYYRYNDERMKANSKWDINDYRTWKNEMFMDEIADKYSFNFDNIYIIGTYNTASASELTINALRGIGKNVVLVGDTTNGKDVGMEVTGKVIGTYSYQLAAITFQSYNCNGESNYDNGFVPQFEANKYFTINNRPVDLGDLLPENWGLNDSDKIDDAGLLLAVEAIARTSGGSSTARKSVARNITRTIGTKRLPMPAQMRDFRKTNMYMEYQEPEE